MKKDLFEQFAENSEDIRMSPSDKSWDKLQARLSQEKKEPKYRTLLKQISIAAAISLIAINVIALLFFIDKMNDNKEATGLVLVEVPESQNGSPRIVPVSYFDQVNIQEGSRNNKLVNQRPAFNKDQGSLQIDFSDTYGIWTDSNQSVELSIYQADENELFISIKDDNGRLLIKARQDGNAIRITNKKGQFRGLLVQEIVADKNGLKLIDKKGSLFIERTDDHSISILQSNDAGLVHHLLNKII